MDQNIRSKVVDAWWKDFYLKSYRNLIALEFVTISFLVLTNLYLFFTKRDASVPLSLTGDDGSGILWMFVYAVGLIILSFFLNESVKINYSFKEYANNNKFLDNVRHNGVSFIHNYINAKDMLSIKQPLIHKKNNTERTYTINETGELITNDYVFDKRFIPQLSYVVIGLSTIGLLMNIFTSVDFFDWYSLMVISVFLGLIVIYIRAKIARWKLNRHLKSIQSDGFNYESYGFILNYNHYSGGESIAFVFKGKTLDVSYLTKNSIELVLKTSNKMLELIDKVYATMEIVNNKELAISNGLNEGMRRTSIEKLKVMVDFYIPTSIKWIQESGDDDEFKTYLIKIKNRRAIESRHWLEKKEIDREMERNPMPDKTPSIKVMLSNYAELYKNIKSQVQEVNAIQAKLGIQNHTATESLNALFEETATKSNSIVENYFYSNKTRVMDKSLNRELIPKLERMALLANDEDANLIASKIDEIKAYFKKQVQMDAAEAQTLTPDQALISSDFGEDVTSQAIKKSLESVDYYMRELDQHW